MTSQNDDLVERKQAKKAESLQAFKKKRALTDELVKVHGVNPTLKDEDILTVYARSRGSIGNIFRGLRVGVTQDVVDSDPTDGVVDSDQTDDWFYDMDPSDPIYNTDKTDGKPSDGA